MKIRLSLTKSGIQKAIDDLAAYRRSLERRLETLVDRLAAEGLSVASIRFANANYAGDNDVTVYMENDGKAARICAEGSAVAFIEFGTGVQNPDYPGSAAAPYRQVSYG